MVYRSFKHLPRRTSSYKILHGKPFEIAKNPKSGGYQRGFVSMAYKSFDRKQKVLLEINRY